jgi:hypothetical protein
MECNIDSRGQLVRRIWGTLCILAALAAAAFAFFTGPWWLYLVAAFLLAAGLFAFWEARKKWCVVRALGVKTPL